MKKKPVVLKIIAGMTAIALTVGLIYLLTSFVGNPISAHFAKKAINQYVEDNYAFLDLDVGKVEYNFKFGSYSALAQSRTSIDTKFYIYYRNGEILYDEYESQVLGRYNTISRLEEEYSTIAKNVIADELGFEDNTTRVTFDSNVYENTPSEIELDMKFDKSIPVEKEVTIQFQSDNFSIKDAVKILEDAYNAFESRDCHFETYSFYSEDNLMVTGVKVEHITSGELEEVLLEASQRDSYQGVSVTFHNE